MTKKDDERSQAPDHSAKRSSRKKDYGEEYTVREIPYSIDHLVASNTDRNGCRQVCNSLLSWMIDCDAPKLPVGSASLDHVAVLRRQLVEIQKRLGIEDCVDHDGNGADPLVESHVSMAERQSDLTAECVLGMGRWV